jgi:hypothetical protein
LYRVNTHAEPAPGNPSGKEATGVAIDDYAFTEDVVE